MIPHKKKVFVFGFRKKKSIFLTRIKRKMEEVSERLETWV